MYDDPIIQEVREIRDQIAERFNYDVQAIGAYYQALQKDQQLDVVTLEPQRIGAGRAALNYEPPAAATQEELWVEREVEDPILEELHKFREEIAAKHNYDVHAIAAEIRRLQPAENRQVVTLPPKRVVPDADISEVKERVSDLIHREKTTGLSPEETSELDDYMTLEHLGILAKARLRRNQMIGNEASHPVPELG